VSMTAALGSTRNVIEVINALNRKRHMLATFDKREVPAPISNLGQVNNLIKLDLQWLPLQFVVQLSP
jgi:hypothetical protein